MDELGEVFREWTLQRVSLRVSGDGVPLDDLGHILGIEPTAIATKGTVIDQGLGTAVCDSDTWIWDYPANAWLPFEEQIAGLLDRLEPHRSSLSDFFETSDADGVLWLAFGSGEGQGSAHLSRELLARIVSFGLAVAFELFPPPAVG